MEPYHKLRHHGWRNRYAQKMFQLIAESHLGLRWSCMFFRLDCRFAFERRTINRPQLRSRESSRKIFLRKICSRENYERASRETGRCYIVQTNDQSPSFDSQSAQAQRLRAGASLMAQRNVLAAGDAIETTLSKNNAAAYSDRIGSRDAVRNGKSLAIGQYWRQQRSFRRAAKINICSQSRHNRLRACTTNVA